MGSSEDWREVTTALNDRFRCLAVDLPGHGASLGLPAEDYTVKGATRLLRRFSDKTSLSEGAGQQTLTSD
jgi:pimeloyl-ACP methyl ester carboxylesterase